MINVDQHAATSEQQILYQSLDSSLRKSDFDGSAAQAHGIACGFVCRNVPSTELEATAAHLSFTDSPSMTALESLIDMSLRDLNQAEFSFDLWLPDVEALEPQIVALSDWAQGFVMGLLHDGNEILNQLNTEQQNSIEDIIQIAGLDATTSEETDDETAFFELREYLRMAAQLIFEELNADRPLEPLHD